MRAVVAKQLRRQAKATDGATLEREYDEVKTLKKVKGPDGKYHLVQSTTLVNKPTSVRGIYRALKKESRHGQPFAQ